MAQPSPEPSSTERPYTLHIVLATTPLKNQVKYIEKIEQKFYKRYVEKTDLYYRTKGDESLYKPIKYYMFGHYDVAFISVIDSFKFAQKLFIPDDLEVEQIFNPISLQVITGICLLHSQSPEAAGDRQPDLANFFQQLRMENSESQRRLFVSIINLKINNGLLVGNGRVLLQAIVDKIDALLLEYSKDNKAGHLSYVILQSFSWHELNVVCFIEDLGFVSTILQTLRVLTLADLPDKLAADVLKRSLYGKKVKDVKEAAATVHLFADTQTYLGVDYSVVEKPPGDGVEKVINDCQVETETEWKVKPGYGSQLYEALRQNGFSMNPNRKANQTNFVLTGKTDYLMPGVRTKLADSIRLFRWLISGNDTLDVIRHVRKIKTRILIPALFEPAKDVRGKPDYNDIIQALRVMDEEIAQVDAGLKRQKISHQLRNKVKRILYIYNNEIQDHILFPYFVDFYWFICRLVEDCSAENANTRVSILEQEKKLIRFIRTFEEGHRLRVLNSYQFEEVNDFDLDFHASIQQLLSIYHSLVLNVSNLFYPDYQHCPVVQLNWNDSVANVISINYNLHHLLSPEFIFSTIAMDILVPNFDDAASSPQLATIRKKFEMLLMEDDFLQEYQESNLIRFVNLLSDAIRFVFTFNGDARLFRFWLWSYDFQNPVVFNENGSMDESHFQAELFRFTFVYQLFGLGSLVTEESCPIPEIQTYWSRYYYKTNRAVNALLKSRLQLDMQLEDGEEVILKKEDTVTILFRKLLCFFLVEPLKRQVSESTTINKFLSKWRKKLDPDEAVPVQENSGLLKVFKDHSNLWDSIRGRDEILQIFHGLYNRQLQNGLPIYYDESRHFNTSIYLASMMYSYLMIIAERNGYEVRALRRSWQTGEPMKIFVSNITDDRIYSVDPLGGLFFDSRNSHQAYFILRNALLKSLWHFTQEQKKIYIDHIMEPPKKKG